jgi:hypothetical protein
MKRAPTLPLRRGGILQLSTWLILAGGTASLMSCDSSERQAMQARASYESESKRLIEELDSQRQQLLSGEVPNNFQIPGIGYYHAGAHDFYEHSYNFQRDGKWFVNNAWLDQAGPEDVPASRPTPEALRRIDETLDKQQRELDATADTAARYQHQAQAGPGLGSTLMMFWLLSGNRGFFSPGPGFTSFGQRAPMWESRYRHDRDEYARTKAYSGGGGGGSYSSSSKSSRPAGPPSSSSSSYSSSRDSGGSAHPSSSPSSNGSHSSTPSSRGGFGSHGGSSSS